MKRAVIASIAVLAFGAARFPVEQRLATEVQAAGLRGPELKQSLREQIPQMAFVASLSGFRSLIASILFIQAYEAWTDPIDGAGPQWNRMATLFRAVTTLQPKSELYWDMAGWHMAYNASDWALEDEKNQPSEPLRRIEQKHFFELGKQFFEDGIANNPDSYNLPRALGTFYLQKYEDHCKAAAAYQDAADKPGAPRFLKRIAAIELAKCPGHEQQAYDRLMAIYNLGPTERTPSVITSIHDLEEKLGIPADKRIKETNAQ